MTEEFLIDRKKDLLEMKRSMKEKILKDNPDSGGVPPTPGKEDPESGGARADNHDSAVGQGMADRLRLRQIIDALDAISIGTYGICRECGKKIPEERLRAIPYALDCLECGNARENMGRYAQEIGDIDSDTDRFRFEI